MKAPINKIIPFSNVDGPGNRTSIFVQGCPFQCLYCHNPETIHLCNHCGACVQTCPARALSIKNGKVVWKEKTCIQCDTCIHVCPNMASPKVHLLSGKQVYHQITPYLDYIEGITVSGGECMNYPSFLIELFGLVKKKNKTCFLDSNGYFLFEQYPELMKLCDGVMLDVKAWDSSFHQELCGAKNDTVIKNLRWLQKNKKLYEVRTVCMPNQSRQNTITVQETAKRLNPNIRYKLIKYRPFGVRNKGLKALGNNITTDHQIQALENTAKKAGCKNIVLV